MNKCKNYSQGGFAHVLLLLIFVAVVGVVSIAGWRVYQINKDIDAEASTTGWPSGALTTIGKPQLYIQGYNDNSQYVNGRYNFETKQITEVSTEKVNPGTTDSNNTSNLQIDITTGNLFYILSDQSGIGVLNKYDNKNGLATPEYTVNDVLKITRSEYSQENNGYVTTNFCVGNGNYAQVFTWSKNGGSGSTKSALFIKSTTTGKSKRVVIDEDTYVGNLSCSSKNLYFIMNKPGVSTRMYKISLDPNWTKAKPVDVTFNLIENSLWAFSTCGGQFNKDNKVVYITQAPINNTGDRKIAVVDYVKKSAKYYDYQVNSSFKDPYVADCTLSPDSTTVFVSIGDFFTPNSKTVTGYLTLNGKKSYHTFPTMIDNSALIGWLGTNTNL